MVIYIFVLSIPTLNWQFTHLFLIPALD